EIGHALGYGHAYDLPQFTVMGGAEDGALAGREFEPVFPGDADVVHGQYMYRKDSLDVDFYEFSLTEGGTFSAEVLAERMDQASLLDSAIALYRKNTRNVQVTVLENGAPATKTQTVVSYDLVARNDDYYSEDSFLEVYLEKGDYYIGVSASGNEDYDGNLEETGIGGTTQGAYKLRLNFAPGGVNPDDPGTFTGNGSRHMVDTTGVLFDGDADGVPGGEYNFWFNVQSEADTIFVDKAASAAGADGSLAHPFPTIDSPLVPDAFDLAQAKVNAKIGTTKVAAGLAETSVIVRVVGNNFDNDDLDNDATYRDNLAYEVGKGQYQTPANVLADGANLLVPKGVTMMIDAGAVFKMREAGIDVGSSAVGIDRSGGALQVLGTPEHSVIFTSYHDETIGNDTEAQDTQPAQGDWTGLIFRNKIDREFIEGYDPASTSAPRALAETQGIFVNYVNHADIRYGGGGIGSGVNRRVYAPVHMEEARPTVTYNTMTNSAGAAISGDPNAFRESEFENWDPSAPFTADYGRVGPEVRNNLLTSIYRTDPTLAPQEYANTFNGMFVRIDTQAGRPITELEVASRFDDVDIVHILSQSLIINGTPGGAVLTEATNTLTLSADGYRITAKTGNQINDGDRFSLYDGSTRVTFEFDLLVPTYNAGTGTWSMVANGVTPGHVAIRYSKLPLNPGGDPPIASDEYTADRIAELISDAINRAHVSPLDPGATADARGLDVSATSAAAVVTLHVEGPTVSVEGFQGHEARQDARLRIDPGVIIKLDGARIETEMGAQLIAEGRAGSAEGAPGYKVVFTSVLDNRFGAGGTFNSSENISGKAPGPGDWAGLSFGPLSEGSMDQAIIAYGGGTAAIEGGFATFNPVEVRQAHVRIANSRFENNQAGSAGDRNGRGYVDPATIYVRGAQPVIVGNDFLNNNGAIISIDANSLKAINVPDWGRSTGFASTLDAYDANFGPLVRDNRMMIEDEAKAKGVGLTGLLGMEVRGGTLTTESIWDDTDIVHILRSEIIVPNFHHVGGLRLQSAPEESLVVKLLSEDLDGDGNLDAGEDFNSNGRLDEAAFTALGTTQEIDDRIGGTVQIVGMPGQPVVLTSLRDDTVSAGFDLLDRPQFDTDNNGILYNATGFPISQGRPGDWRSVKLEKYSNDRNVAVVNEIEDPSGTSQDANFDWSIAQVLGQLAGYPDPANPANVDPTVYGPITADRFEKAGDDNLRLGFEIHGTIRTDAANDADVYRFDAPAGTEIWLDIDRTTHHLDAIVELIDEDGKVLARSDNSVQELLSQNTVGDTDPTGTDRGLLYEADQQLHVKTMDRDTWQRTDFYTTNQRDPGMRLVLPGTPGELQTYYVRVRSSLAIGDIVDGSQILDGATFAVGNGLRTVVFEFENSNAANWVTGRNYADATYTVLIPISNADSAAVVAQKMADAINTNMSALSPSITAVVMPDGTVRIDGAHGGFRPQPFEHLQGETNYKLGTPFTTLANTSGNYQLQLRLREFQEVPGSTVQGAEIRYATNGIEVYGFPGHSPLLGETTENGDASSTFGSAQNIGNLLDSDQSVLSLAGSLTSQNDVDWYRFSLDHTGMQSIPGESGFASLWSMIFDIDYADGMSRPDLRMWVYDAGGTLLFTGDSSNVSDDRPEPIAEANIENLSRGSVGSGDPFIGPAFLSEGDGRTYYIAVTSALATSNELTDASSQTRREPINSVNRIVSEHILPPLNDGRAGDWNTTPPYVTEDSQYPDQNYDSFDPSGTPIPEYLGKRLTIVPNEFNLADVVTYITTGGDIYTINPFTGDFQTDVSDSSDPTGGDLLYQDIAMRDDGWLTALEYRGTNVQNGDYVRISTENANTQTVLATTGINTYEQDPANPTSLRVDPFGGVRFEALVHDFDNATTGPADNVRNVFAVGNARGVAGAGTFTTNLMYVLRANGGAVQYPVAPTGGLGGPRVTSDIVPFGQLFPTDAGASITGLAYLETNGRRLDGVEASATNVGGVWQMFAVDNDGRLYKVNFKTSGGGFVETPDPDSTGHWGFYPVNPSSGYYYINKNSYGPELEEIKEVTWGPTNTPIVFTGLAAGPPSVQDGMYATTLFATDSQYLYALDMEGNLLPIFKDGAQRVPLPSSSVAGIAFSPIDYNLWHMTYNRWHSTDHGIPSTADGTRNGEQNYPYEGDYSLYFGLENPTNYSGEYLDGYAVQQNLATGRREAAQPGSYNFHSQRNSTAGSTEVYESYNLPGGAHGSMTSEVFSLAGYDAQDKPVLYFTYLAETENSNSFDGAKVYISNNGADWDLVATNTDTTQGNRRLTGINQLMQTPTDPTRVIDEIVDDGLWRQARVDLSRYAGLDNLRLRFDFSTASDLEINDTVYQAEVYRHHYLSGVAAYNLTDGNENSRPANSFFTIEGNRKWNGSFNIDASLRDPQRFEFDLGYSLVLPNVAGKTISDGEYFDVGDGVDTYVRFEFSKNESGWTPNGIAPTPGGVYTNVSYRNINITDAMTTADVAAAIEAAISGSGLDIRTIRNAADPNRVFLTRAMVVANGTFRAGDTKDIYVQGSAPGSITPLGSLPTYSAGVSYSQNIRVPITADMTAAQVSEVIKQVVNQQLRRTVQRQGGAVNDFTDPQRIRVDGRPTDGRTFSIRGVTHRGDFKTVTFTFVAGAPTAPNQIQNSANLLTLADRIAAAINAVNADAGFELNISASHTGGGEIILTGPVTFFDAGTANNLASTPVQLNLVMLNADETIIQWDGVRDANDSPLAVNADLDPTTGDSMHVIGHRVLQQGPLGLSTDSDNLGALQGEQTGWTPNTNLQGWIDHSADGRSDNRYELYERGQDNQYEGFYIDDIVIGFAERGEMVTNADRGGNDTGFSIAPVPNPDIYPAETAMVVTGDYQLEIRQGTHYGEASGAKSYPVTTMTDTYDTNDRHVQELTLIVPAAEAIPHGRRFSIYDGLDTYEFVLLDETIGGGGGVSGKAIYFNAGDSSTAIAAKIAQAINESTVANILRVTASARRNGKWVDLSGAVSVKVWNGAWVDLSGAGTVGGFDLDEPNKLGSLHTGTPNGDQNHRREKGQIIIDRNTVLYSEQFGIRVGPSERDFGAANLAHPAAPRTANAPGQLVPGILVENNVVAFGGTGGIQFNGDNAAGPTAAMPFGRIVNNTIYGQPTRAGVGVQVGPNASPTILNNILANLQNGVTINASSISTVLGGNLYQNVGDKPTVGDFANFEKVIAANAALFVDPANANFYLKEYSAAIDTSIQSVEERQSFFDQILEPLGIAVSPIVAPDYDLFGQKREPGRALSVDPGLGENPHIDRGAIDRVDDAGPSAMLVIPADAIDPLSPDDLDVNGRRHDVALIGEDVFEFAIQLTDIGAGINDRSVLATTVDVYRHDAADTDFNAGTRLTLDSDYFFIYNSTTNKIRLLPSNGVWTPGYIYRIELLSSIQDLAANPLQPNRPNAAGDPLASGTTQFLVSLLGLDFGDAPDDGSGMYPTLYKEGTALDGARHRVNAQIYLGPATGGVSDEASPRLNNTDTMDDGVIPDTGLLLGKYVGFTVYASVDGFLDAWIDFDQDQDWTDNGKIVVYGSLDVNGLPVGPALNDVRGSIPLDAGANRFYVYVNPSLSVGSTYGRFRFSTAGGLGVTGEALDGEVEDWLLGVIDALTDFGDAPNSYLTTLDADGARHKIAEIGTSGELLHLGSGTGAIDDDIDGQPTADATGDDLLDMNDDEDGIEFLTDVLVAGAGQTTRPGGGTNDLIPAAQVLVTSNLPVSPGDRYWLQGWIDFDGSNTFDASEKAIHVELVSESQVVDFSVPWFIQPGTSIARFRLSTDPSLTHYGLADDGEVEDYEVELVSAALDFGDAPANTYPTALADDGARHGYVYGSNVHLGAGIDIESDAQVDVANPALGDDLDNLDDEDGIRIGSVDPNNALYGKLKVGAGSWIYVDAASNGYLNAWIDWDDNGDWDSVYTDASQVAHSEHFLVNVPILNNPPQPNDPNFVLFDGRWWQKIKVTDDQLPAGLSAVDSFARFRFTSGAPGAQPGQPGYGPKYVGLTPSYFGQYPDGEVEDYTVSTIVGTGKISGKKFVDLDASGGLANAAPAVQSIALPNFGTFGTQVLTSTDDGSTGALDFNFSDGFQFYGQTYNQFYINSNGNISLGGSLSEFIPQGFPQTTAAVIAPFWADVDMRAGGQVRWGQSLPGDPVKWVRIDWVDVGYFNQHIDKRNSFSLYIEDDPSGVNGDIVVFDYVDMNWTTGDPSTTVVGNGFGGEGGQVGFDAGDGNPAHYVSVMRPNSPEGLSDLLQREQIAYRIHPASGVPVQPEVGLSGVEIYLDLNNDGVWGLDAFDKPEPKTTTWNDLVSTPLIDETGYYEFTGLFEGTYRVRELLTNVDMVQTYPAQPEHVPAGTRELRVLQDNSPQLDGKIFVVDDGVNPAVTFALDIDGSVVPTATLRGVDISAAVSGEDIAAAIGAAVAAAPALDVSATVSGDTVTLAVAPGGAFTLDLRDLDGLVDNGFWTIELGEGDAVGDVDFGNYVVPEVSVSNVAVWEGNAGQTIANVTVHVTRSFGSRLKIDYYTEDGSAKVADGDYREEPQIRSIYIEPAQETPVGVWSPMVLETTGQVVPSFDVAGDYVVWEAGAAGAREIVFYDAANNLVQRLTQNTRDDYSPKVHLSADGLKAYVVWVGRDTANRSQVFLYTYDTVTGTGEKSQLTNTTAGVSDPQVSSTAGPAGGNAYVTWVGGTGASSEIYFYDVAARSVSNLSTKVTGHTGMEDRAPQISGDLVAWYGWDGKDYEVYLYDHPKALANPSTYRAVQVTSNSNLADDSVQIGGVLNTSGALVGGNVVWRGRNGTDYDIFLYQYNRATGAGTTIQITDSGTFASPNDDNTPQVSGEYVVWQGYDGVNPGNPADRGDWDIYRYHIPSGAIANVSANAAIDDANPQIDGSRVVWESQRLGATAAGNWEIVHRDLALRAIAQNVSQDPAKEDRAPLVTGNLAVWRSYDGQNYRINIARQAEAEIVASIPLVVYGDTRKEPNEFFRLYIDGVTVVNLGIDALVGNDQADVEILNDDAGLDFGDAPESYGTLLADNGARHTVETDFNGEPVPKLYLGTRSPASSMVDLEADGQPSLDALGDDVVVGNSIRDDEDGLLSLVTQVTPWIGVDGLVSGKSADLEVNVVKETAASQKAWLSAWIDLNGDGVWSNFTDATGNSVSEQVLPPTEVTDLFNRLSFSIPAGLEAKTTYMRLRLASDDTDVANPTGLAKDGEVEDYLVEIKEGTGTISGRKFEDLNADGVWGNPGTALFVSPGDLAAVTAGNVVLSNTDDGSIAQALGFSFDFYGQTYNTFYINNNGNISFGAPQNQFIPQGFPNSTPIIAPFWADADTRTSAGDVRVTGGTSVRNQPYIQVNWLDVGYFDQTDANNTDARNAFSLYIEDDPSGDIVVFHYQRMEWTTGDATGTDGFGGLGAQIGFNAGDGVNAMSLMRPDSAEELSDLLQIEQFAYRFEPGTGRPVVPEPGLAGVKVYLDLNQPGDPGWGIHDANEPYTYTLADDLSTPYVDETGYYQFTGLFDGTYRVREELPGAEWVQTSPNATANLPAGTWRIRTDEGSAFSDTRTFTVGDGADTVTFEFDLIGSAPVGSLNTPVPFRQTWSAAQMANAIATAINGVARLNVTAAAVDDVITLTAESGASVNVTFGSNIPFENVTSTSHAEGYYTVTLVEPGEEFQGANFGNYRKPHVEVGNAVVAEGDSGTKTVEVEVHVKKSYGATVTVDYHTLDGTVAGYDAKTGDNDYVPVSNGQLVIGPHETPTGAWTSAEVATTVPQEQQGTNQVDIIFLFDTSGTMGSSINDVQQNLLLMDSAMLAAGINAEYALVEFPRDTSDEAVMTQDVTDFGTFTSPAGAFLNIQIRGAIENGSVAVLEGLNEFDPTGYPATTLNFRPGSKIALVMLTDEPDSGTDAQFTAAMAALVNQNALFSYIGLTTADFYYGNSDARYGAMARATGGGSFQISAFRNDPTNFFAAFTQFLVGQVVTEELPDYYYDVSGDFVAWSAIDGTDSDVFLHNTVSGATRQLTNDSYSSQSVKVHGSNVVWVGHDGVFGPGGTGDDSQIYLYDIHTQTTVQVTHTLNLVGDPQVSDTHVTWWEDTPTGRDIFVYDIATKVITNVSALVYDHAGLKDEDPQISGSRVVWTGFDGKDREIYRYDAAAGTSVAVTGNL
ncbi:MAG: hypothetical protein HUU20_14055, partial [Pirellulales bacterium]|nr:hypothetical protein [Pirellulales bacterium]